MVEYKAILGPAGTGKSYSINQELKNDPRYCFRTGSTGSNALNFVDVGNDNINLTEDGITINSALKYFDTEELSNNIRKLLIFKRFRNIAKTYSNLAIDEATLIGAEQLDLIMLALEVYNSDVVNPPLGLILLGDFGQLAPVKKKPLFKSKYWNNIQIEKLYEVKRQTNKEFIEVLHQIRLGKVTKVIDWIVDNIKFTKSLNDEFQGITMLSKNAQVNSYNIRQLNKLSTKEKIYKAKVTGEPPKQWNNNPLKSTILHSITLKEGVIVTTTRNNLNAGYSNGSIGKVMSLNDSFVDVYFPHLDLTLPIEFCKLNNKIIREKSDGSFKEKNLGTVSYMPLKIAYASTLYRIQGWTISGNLQASLVNAFRCHGFLYTLLSRITDYNNLSLVGSPDDLINLNVVDKSYLPYL